MCTLDAESISISSSTNSSAAGRRSGARQILSMALPGIKTQSRGASMEKTVNMENIPEQLRTPKVPQVGHKKQLFNV